MRQWDSVVEGYVASGEARGLSQESLGSIRDELDRCGCWLKRRRPKPRLEEVDGQLLIQYLRSRTRFRAKATVSGIASKLRCFGEYLVHQGVWPNNPMRWVRGPRLDPRGRLPRRIGAEHLRQLWEAAPRQRGNYSQQLSVAVLSLLYGTGLRRGELERLNLGDWKPEEQLLAIDGRKTGNERQVPVSEGIARCLEAYLPLRQNLMERRGTLSETALLINRQGKRLSAQCLGLLVHRLARKAKVPLVSLHQFRHTCASDLLESGASLMEVKDILGHRSVESTSRYLHIAGPERAQAIGKHPLNDYLPALLAKEEGTRV
jgi:site-specific recombinase XerD